MVRATTPTTLAHVAGDRLYVETVEHGAPARRHSLVSIERCARPEKPSWRFAQVVADGAEHTATPRACRDRRWSSAHTISAECGRRLPCHSLLRQPTSADSGNRRSTRPDRGRSNRRRRPAATGADPPHTRSAGRSSSDPRQIACLRPIASAKRAANWTPRRREGCPPNVRVEALSTCAAASPSGRRRFTCTAGERSQAIALIEITPRAPPPGASTDLPTRKGAMSAPDSIRAAATRRRP